MWPFDKKLIVWLAAHVWTWDSTVHWSVWVGATSGFHWLTSLNYTKGQIRFEVAVEFLFSFTKVSRIPKKIVNGLLSTKIWQKLFFVIFKMNFQHTYIIVNLKERHDVIIQMNYVFPHNYVISPCFANLWLKNAFVDQFNNSQLKPFLLWSKSKIIPNHLEKINIKMGTYQLYNAPMVNPRIRTKGKFNHNS